MERYKEDFASKLKGFDLETLENSRHSIYALSKDMVFIPAKLTPIPGY